MSQLTYSLKRKGNTVTFKTGRYVESFDIEFIGFFELYERLRFAALTAGLRLNQPTLEKLLREVKDLTGGE